MTIRDPHYDQMIARQQQAGGLYSGYRASTPTPDEAIDALRKRCAHLRSQIASVPEWEAELLRIEATLKAWGDK